MSDTNPDRRQLALVTAVIVVLLVTVVGLAILGYPGLAVYTAAGLLFMSALIRLMRPSGVWRGRSRVFDGAFLAVFALTLLILAPLAGK